MQSPVVAPETPNQYDQPDVAQHDYFGFQQTSRFIFPDGVTYFEIASMNEGQKARYQKKTSRDLILERQSGNARMKMDAAEERHTLIKECVVGWNLTRGGEPLPQPQDPKGKIQMNDFLELANPKLIEDIEKAIRKANPWLLAEMTSEDIQREIDNLEEMKKVALERERGESS